MRRHVVDCSGKAKDDSATDRDEIGCGSDSASVDSGHSPVADLRDTEINTRKDSEIDSAKNFILKLRAVIRVGKLLRVGLVAAGTNRELCVGLDG